MTISTQLDLLREVCDNLNIITNSDYILSSFTQHDGWFSFELKNAQNNVIGFYAHQGTVFMFNQNKFKDFFKSLKEMGVNMA